MRPCLIFFLFLFSLSLQAQTLPPIPQRLVSIDCENRRVDDVLHDISAQGKFEFSWSSDLFDASRTVSLHEKNITVRQSIYLLFGNSITYKIRDDYVILLAAPVPVATNNGTKPHKQEYTISGYTIDQNTGIGVSYVSVYDSITLTSTLSDYYGFYTLKLNGSAKPVNLKASRQFYSDTTFSVVPSADISHDIILHRTPAAPIPLSGNNTQKNDSTISNQENVEELPFIDSLIGFEQLMQSRNLQEFLKRGGQISLLPFISTNGKMSGNVVNRFSLNIIGGYTGGTNGFEIGAGINIDRGDVRGVQVCAGANAVGGNVKGLQMAGGLNFTMGSLHGVQLSSGSNFLLDTLKGLQIAGGANLIRGRVYGGQISGGINIATKDLDGFQITSGLNFTNGTMNKVQIAAGLNYAGKTKGLQLAAGANICSDTAEGTQIAAGFNFARHMNGTQFAALNFTQELKGFQLGILNIADTCNGGIPIGVLSFVRKGLHELEISSDENAFLNLTFRTGVRAFHSILTAGFDPQNAAWTFGYGFGHDFQLGKKFAINLDVYTQHFNLSDFASYTNEWTKLDLLLEWKPAHNFGIAAGPTFNYFLTGASENQSQPQHSKSIFTGSPSPGFSDYAWIGGKIALRFF